MKLKLLQELNTLTDKLYALDKRIELELESSDLSKAELLVVQRNDLIIIITKLFQKAEESNLPASSLELLKTIQNKINLIFDNNDYLMDLFVKEKEKIEDEIRLASLNKNKIKGYNLSSSLSN